MYRDTGTRSLFKTLSWRAIATITTSLIVWFLTRRFEFALLVGGLDTMSKLLLYFLHERAWDRSHWGRRPVTPAVIWFTGLSGSGKNRIAKWVFEDLRMRGVKVDYLDGHAIRDLFPATGFSRPEREAHIRRVGFLASRLEQQGVFVVAAFLSPDREARDFVRGLCSNFVEVFVATPLEDCERRDLQGLYARARRGEIRHFPGVDDPYEAPERAEVEVDLRQDAVEQAGSRVVELIRHHF